MSTEPRSAASARELPNERTSEDIYGGRSLAQIRELGAAWLTEKELERMCEWIDYLETMKRCNETAPDQSPGIFPGPIFCDRWPEHDGPHRNAETASEWGKDAGRLDAR